MATSFFQAAVVQKMDSAIHRRKKYPVDKYYESQLQYPLVNDLSGGFRYPPLTEQMFLLIPN